MNLVSLWRRIRWAHKARHLRARLTRATTSFTLVILLAALNSLIVSLASTHYNTKPHFDLRNVLSNSVPMPPPHFRGF